MIKRRREQKFTGGTATVMAIQQNASRQASHSFSKVQYICSGGGGSGRWMDAAGRQAQPNTDCTHTARPRQMAATHGSLFYTVCNCCTAEFSRMQQHAPRIAGANSKRTALFVCCLCLVLCLRLHHITLGAK